MSGNTPPRPKLAEPCEETGERLWLCPRLSAHGAGWLIDRYRADGAFTGARLANDGERAWIAANPAEVGEMREKLAAWLTLRKKVIIS